MYRTGILEIESDGLISVAMEPAGGLITLRPIAIRPLGSRIERSWPSVRFIATSRT